VSAEIPEFLAVGHVCLDVVHDRLQGVDAVRPGGTVSYGGLTSRNLGLATAAVTSSAGYRFDEILPGLAVHNVPADETTVFHNCYGAEGRRQALTGRATDIVQSDVPAAWRSSRIVLLGPLTGELPVDAGEWFRDSLVGAVAQGWLRAWDGEGRVSIAVPAGATPLGLDLLVISEADAPAEDVARLGRTARFVALTRAERGVRLRVGAEWHDIPAVPARRVIDPTGAGDVWAAAYLIRYSETGNPFKAARFASAAGALCVEKPGLAGVPQRAEIEARLAETSG